MRAIDSLVDCPIIAHFLACPSPRPRSRCRLDGLDVTDMLAASLPPPPHFVIPEIVLPRNWWYARPC